MTRPSYRLEHALLDPPARAAAEGPTRDCYNSRMEGPLRVDNVLRDAARLADEVLFPRVGETDASDLVPIDSLDALAAAGLYGVAGPRRAGGLELAVSEALQVTEELARGCLATAFVWLQHHGSVRAVAAAGGELSERYLEPLCRGKIRSGVAFAGLRRPGPPILVASRQTDGAFLLDGHIPWLTGWGAIDVALVAAREEGRRGDVVWLLVEAGEGDGLAVDRLRLMAMDATATVSAELSQLRVPGDRVVAVEPYEEWVARDAAGLRTNGSMALGLGRRVVSLLGQRGAEEVAASFAGLLDAARDGLDRASVAELPRARARAVDVVMQAAMALVVARGGRALVRGELEEVLARQAVFLLVFGQTPAIKAEQLSLAAGV